MRVGVETKLMSFWGLSLSDAFFHLELFGFIIIFISVYLFWVKTAMPTSRSNLSWMDCSHSYTIVTVKLEGGVLTYDSVEAAAFHTFRTWNLNEVGKCSIIYVGSASWFQWQCRAKSASICQRLKPNFFKIHLWLSLSPHEIHFLWDGD
jgi:hypothetical protein